MFKVQVYKSIIHKELKTLAMYLKLVMIAFNNVIFYDYGN